MIRFIIAAASGVNISPCFAPVRAALTALSKADFRMLICSGVASFDIAGISRPTPDRISE
jgi:hypothetical protein